MQNSMWKLATLLGVIGIGCLVVMQVQRGLEQSDQATATQPGAEESTEGDPGDDLFASGADVVDDDDDLFGFNQFEPNEAADQPVSQTAYQTQPNSPQNGASGSDPGSLDAGFDFRDESQTAPSSTAFAADGTTTDSFDPGATDSFDPAAFDDDPPQQPAGTASLDSGESDLFDGDNPFGPQSDTTSAEYPRDTPQTRETLAAPDVSSESRVAQSGQPSFPAPEEDLARPRNPSLPPFDTRESTSAVTADAAEESGEDLFGGGEFNADPVEPALLFGHEDPPADRRESQPPTAPQPLPSVEDAFGDERTGAGGPTAQRSDSPWASDDDGPAFHDSASSAEPTKVVARESYSSAQHSFSSETSTVQERTSSVTSDEVLFGDETTTASSGQSEEAFGTVSARREVTSQRQSGDSQTQTDSRAGVADAGNPFPIDDSPDDGPLFGDDTGATAQPALSTGGTAAPSNAANSGGPAMTLPGREPRPLPTLPAGSSSQDEPARLTDTQTATSADQSLDMMPEGTLRPQLRIEKSAPTNAALGKPLIYHILIRNVGNAVAHEVVVEDQIPAGSRLTGTIPRAELIDGKLVWRFKTLEPNLEKKIAVRVIPEREGQIGSVATVNFKAEVGARTRVTAPRLAFRLSGPPEAKIGETVTYRYRIANIGSGDATNIWIRNPLPTELQHPEGSDLEYKVGDLAAGETREVALRLVAASAGETVNSATVTADGGVSEEGEATISILGAQLEVTRRGPRRRYLGREAVYENAVTNKTHREAVNATLIEHIPDGMKFVEASDGGQYNDARRTVAWRIDRLAGNETRAYRVKLQAARPGEQESVVQVVEQAGFESRAASQTVIETLHTMGLRLSEVQGPVALGERLSFTISIRNRGTAPATNVRLSLAIPPQLEVRAAGPLKATRVGQTVEFPAVPEIPVGGISQFEVTVEASQVGDVRLRASIQSDQMPKSLLTEEAIRIFDDSE